MLRTIRNTPLTYTEIIAIFGYANRTGEPEQDWAQSTSVRLANSGSGILFGSAQVLKGILIEPRPLFLHEGRLLNVMGRPTFSTTRNER
jgi:hypothetical protein